MPSLLLFYLLPLMLLQINLNLLSPEDRIILALKVVKSNILLLERRAAKIY
jgi:hypothetical protein